MKHRLLAICLILAMVFTVALPVYAVESSSAEETEETAGLPEGVQVEDDGTITWINPMFRGVDVDESTIPETTTASAKKKLKASTSSSSVYEASSFEDAGDYMRQQMKNRAYSVEMVVPEVIGTTTKEALEFMYRYYNEACKDTGDPLEGDYIRSNTYRVQMAYGRGSDTTNVKFIFRYCANAAMEEEMTPVLNELVESFGFTEDSSELDKICTIYDYLSENIVYDEDTENVVAHSAYAGLIDHTCVCQGYASLFYRLALTCGLKARYVTGQGGDNVNGLGNHAWNIVKIEDKYYNIDVTWDADQIQGHYSYAFFLRGSDDFNLTDSEGKVHQHIPEGPTDSDPSAYLPDEMSLLSESKYHIPMDYMVIPESTDFTYNLGRRILLYCCLRSRPAEYSLTRDLTYASGYKPDAVEDTTPRISFSASNNTSANKTWAFDGMKVYWTIKDETTGEEGITPTITLHISDGSELAGYTLSLGDEISVNVYLKLAEEVLRSNDSFVHLDIPSITRKTEDIPVRDGREVEMNGETYYVFSAGVPAKDMTQDLKISCYLDEDNIALDEVTVTIRYYGEQILDTNNNYTEDDRQMVKALLNYGARAQEYFDYHTDDLANSSLDEEDKVLPSPDLSDYTKSIEGSVDGLTYKGTRLIFRTKTLIWHYFETEEDIEKYVFTVNGKIVTPEADEDHENWYILKIDGVSAKLLGQDVPVTVQKPGEEDTLTIHYSAYSYIGSIMNKLEKYGEKAVNVVKALYQYGETAKEYFAAT